MLLRLSNRQALLLVILNLHIIFGARIGDGSRSLYTGRELDPRETRGSCLADGVFYQSETSIPREHPCHYCICYDSQISCFWKQCSAPPPNCQVMNFANVCNPSLYVCSIPEEAKEEPQLSFGDKLNTFRFFRRRRSLTDQSPNRQLPYIQEPVPVEFEEAWKQFSGSKLRRRRSLNDVTTLEDIHGDTSCTILGIRYLLGEVIGVASDMCMECRCAAGSLFCSPKCCFQPAPFAINDQQQSNLLETGRRRDQGLRTNPLHYIKNQYASSSFL